MYKIMYKSLKTECVVGLLTPGCAPRLPVYRTASGSFPTKDLGLVILLQVMSLQNLFSAHFQIGNKPAKYAGRGKTTEQLGQYKPRDIDGPDTRKRIAEAPRNCDRRIRKGSRGR